MIKLKVRVVSELTMEPVKGIRVSIYENDKKIFVDEYTNIDGIVKTRTCLYKDTYVFITVRGYSNTIIKKELIGPDKDLNIDIILKENNLDNHEGILQYFSKTIKEKYGRLYRRRSKVFKEIDT